MVESPDSLVSTTLHEHVAVFTLNRPSKKNALTLDMYATLARAFADAHRDDRVRVVLLRGAGGVFTSGNDLVDFLEHPPTSLDSPVGQFLKALVAFDKPLVAAVAGLAIGVGTTMLLHADLVYAAASTKFALPFTKLGLCPEAGSSYLLPRLAGHARAAELLLLGDPFSAQHAAKIGLITAVIDADKLEAHALERATTLSRLPPEAVRETKRLMKTATADHLHGHLEHEATVFFERLQSEEATQAMRSFFRPAQAATKPGS